MRKIMTRYIIATVTRTSIVKEMATIRYPVADYHKEATVFAMVEDYADASEKTLPWRFAGYGNKNDFDKSDGQHTPIIVDAFEESPTEDLPILGGAKLPD
jgi:hypothetical protein